MTPEERFVRYTEFAAKYGNDNNMDMAGRELGFFAFYSLDIILPFLIIVLLIFYVSYRLMIFVVKKLLNKFLANPYKKLN